MRQGHPAYIQFPGKAGTVVAATGPWNSSGQWWRTDPWDRAEWDVEVGSKQQHTLYRIYQDRRTNNWFVDGIYD
jgi:protein ImuB